MERKDKNGGVVSSTELAHLLGISHVAVYKKIKSNAIKARKVGRNYVIDRDEIPEILGTVLSSRLKRNIDTSVKKIVRQYGDALRRLGRE